MPYVQRDEEGKISAVFNQPNEHAQEEVKPNHPAMMEFLFGTEEVDENLLRGGYFQDLHELRLSDLAFVRVIEDVIYVLLEKKVINITDFPEQVIRKLTTRQKIREQLHKTARGLFESES